MKTRLTLVAILACAGGAFLVLRRAAGTGNPRAATNLAGQDAPSFAPSKRTVTPEDVVHAWPGPKKLTFAEAREHVRALYRKEQLTRELDLEQQRYGEHYWESECDGRELARLQRAREALVRQLNDEANAVLRDLFPGAPGAAIELRGIFDAERAGPNLRFLAPEARERLEAALLGAWDGASLDSGIVRAVAERTFASDELARFLRWNDPAAAALRERLVGFAPSEQEFIALLRAAIDAEGETAAIPAAFSPERVVRLQQIEEPALRSALRDLRRLGLPLAEADWLAKTRADASASIQRVWDDPALSFGAKQGQVALLEQAFSRAIAERLGLPESTIDELRFGP